MDALFAIADNGELTTRGALSAAHMGEHRLAVVARDHGAPPLESRAQVIVTVERARESDADEEKSAQRSGGERSDSASGTLRLLSADNLLPVPIFCS